MILKANDGLNRLLGGGLWDGPICTEHNIFVITLSVLRHGYRALTFASSTPDLYSSCIPCVTMHGQ